MGLRRLFSREPLTREPFVADVGARLGDLQGPAGRIEPTGRVVLDGWGRTVEWGVLAGERWRRANDERAVRQHRVDDTPVYETWMRVPTGDVVQRVGVVNDGHEPSLVVEFENASADAVLVAVVVSTGKDDPGRFSGDVESVHVDAEPWLRADRPAHAVVGGDDGWAGVVGHPADRIGGTVCSEPSAAALYVVPHRQQLSVTVGSVTRTPSIDEVVSGWKAIIDRAAEIEGPDPDLGPAWRRIVGDLIIDAGEPGRADPSGLADAAWWLDVSGLHGEAQRARAAAVDATESGHVRDADAVAVLRALASQDLRAGGPSDLPELAGPLVRMAGASLDRETAVLVARALRASAPEGAADAEALAADAALASRPTDGASLASTAAAAKVVGAVVHEELDGLDLIPGMELGREVDVRGLVTIHGRLSFSLRWHGERPALLWELERHDPEHRVSIRARSIDPGWQSEEAKGETLLQAPQPPAPNQKA